MEKDNKSKIMHIILIVAIVLIFAVAVFKLVRWNMSSKGELQGVETEDNFDTENEDYIAMVNPQYLEGREDDGVLTNVILGDETVGKFTGKDGIASLIDSKTGGNSYDISFPNSTIACKNNIYETNYPDDAFNLYWLAACISIQDYTFLRNALPEATHDNGSFEEKIKLLESIDFNEVDAITVLYGPHDYLNGNLITHVADPNYIGAYTGALKSAVELIQKAFPHIRIVLVSPTYVEVINADGSKSGADVTNTGNGTIADYMIGAKNIAVMTGVTYLDNYYGLPIGPNTADEYLEEGLYPSAKGRELIAERVAKTLKQTTVSE